MEGAWREGKEAAGADAKPLVDRAAGELALLHARLGHEDRVKALLESVAGFTREQLKAFDLLPGDAVIREFIGGSTIPIPHNE